jgi:hypothetical protein
MPGLKPFRLLCASLGVALILAGAICLLPENGYQRWQSLNGTIYENTR